MAVDLINVGLGLLAHEGAVKSLFDVADVQTEGRQIAGVGRHQNRGHAEKTGDVGGEQAEPAPP